MVKSKSFFVVSEWNNDISWVEQYANDYLIFDKSHSLPDGEKILKIPNVGYNIYDIAYFISESYYSLPKLVAFLEGNPFDHCRKEIFDTIIYNEYFTPIEYYGLQPANSLEGRTLDGGFLEFNNNWYIEAHNQSRGLTCKYKSFDDFMNEVFENYYHVDYIRFAPGGQYIVPKENILFYSRSFWKNIMKIVNIPGVPTEGMVVERALYYIFTNRYNERKVYYNL